MYCPNNVSQTELMPTCSLCTSALLATTESIGENIVFRALVDNI